MSALIRRMVGAASFDRQVYEEVEADRGATGQALVVVLLSSVGAGLGWIGLDPTRLWAIAVLTLVAIAGWVAWALITYLIGTRWFPESQTQSDAGELLRTLGFAQSPGILRALGLISGLGPIVTIVVAVWTLATMVVAVRQALDYSSTGRALAVCIVGWLLVLLMFGMIGIFFAAPVS